MTAPVPISGNQKPLLFTAAYQTKQFSSGINTPIVSDVLDTLADPSATATAAEEWSQTFAEETASGTWTYTGTASSDGSQPTDT